MDLRGPAAEALSRAVALRRALDTLDVDWMSADWRSWTLSDGSHLRAARDLEDHLRILAALASRR